MVWERSITFTLKKEKVLGAWAPAVRRSRLGRRGGPMGPRRRFRPESETREGRCGRRSAGHAGRGEPTGRAALGLERCRKPGEPAGAAVLRLPPGRPAGSRRPLRPGALARGRGSAEAGSRGARAEQGACPRVTPRRRKGGPPTGPGGGGRRRPERVGPCAAGAAWARGWERTPCRPSPQSRVAARLRGR